MDMEETVESMKADFCIQIGFQKESPNPSRVFQSMSQLIDGLQYIDSHLVESIDVHIEPILLLEDIETGSIKVLLANLLRAIPDDALRHLDWKPIVGQYLVRAKYAMIDFLQGKTSISNVDELRILEDRIYELAEQTDVRWLPAYKRPQPKELLEGIRQISSGLTPLSEGDSASYVTQEGEIGFNLEFKLAPESIDDLLAKETLSAEGVMILKVKKPDYLGESMWDFRFGERTIQVTISDKEWLERFQTRRIDIRPGDSIRGMVKTSHRYDHDGELIGTHYDLVDVIEVIPIPDSEQMRLLEDDRKDNQQGTRAVE